MFYCFSISLVEGETEMIIDREGWTEKTWRREEDEVEKENSEGREDQVEEEGREYFIFALT
jgi:hypothetical protein